MKPTDTTVAVRERLESILIVPPFRTLGLTTLHQLIPEHSRESIRAGLKAAVKRGTIVRDGTQRWPVYQSTAKVLPETPQFLPEPKKSRAAGAPKLGASTPVRWPDEVKVQIGSTSAWLSHGGPFAGVDWSRATMRPGCLDHLKHPSRRGDRRVPHQLPMGGCVGALRDKRSSARD